METAGAEALNGAGQAISQAIDWASPASAELTTKITSAELDEQLLVEQVGELAPDRGGGGGGQQGLP